jgi:hypothetical protein
MKDSIRFFVGLSLLILIACYGCGPASSEAEMKGAQEAMEAARSFSAEELAPSDWNEAIQAWEEGQTAVKQGKSSKTLFLKAKSRFEKTAKIAKSHYDRISEEVSNMQQSISKRTESMKAALEVRRLSSKVRKEVTPILAEVNAGSASINELLEQGNLLQARDMAREIQNKVYNAELIMEGKKPAL